MAPSTPGPDEGYSEDPMSNQSLSRSRVSSLVDTSSMSESDCERLLLALGTRVGHTTFSRALVALLSRRPPSETLGALDEAVSSWDEEYRKRFALSTMRALRPPLILDIISDVRPKLHINFMDILPPEVCLRILQNLTPKELFHLARASKRCFSLAMDWTLWQLQYQRDGFLINQPELRRFEQQLVESNMRKQSNRERSRSSIGDAPPRKRTRSDQVGFIGAEPDVDMMDIDPVSSQSSIFGLQPLRNDEEDRTSGKFVPFGRTEHQSRETDPLLMFNRFFAPGASGNSFSEASRNTSSDLDAMSSLVTYDRHANKKMVNWQHLYTQRRNLEMNWEKGRFINYQLPHPDYPEESHRECVYTIQHDGHYLVSGSRDKTMRIWNLATRRLVMPPLQGHEGSVLCLQFDADPKEDIIISGSSDSTVRIWQFSTGKLIQVLRKAHHEPVLNVRFDDRFLVTCSKDKTIKVFNRKPLHPGELGYKLPEGFDEIPQVISLYGESPSPYEGLPIKQPFSLLSVLEGHGAAVNAVQILGREVVSASGDRQAKVWDWPTQQCTRSLVGHTKGIACVQYDGRRIVTGSSDNEIKVFDRETCCEVASLQGHSSLVRTVQAGFADLATSREDDIKTATQTDFEYFQAIASGKVTQEMERKFTRNAGSRKPQDIIAYGAKLPPGGGGGSYGRIVSGSYDETIIVWTRDKDGAWVKKHTLRPAEAARDAMVQHELNRPLDNPAQDYLSEIVASIGDGTVQAICSPQGTRDLISKVVPRGVQALRQACRDFPWIVNFPSLINACLAHPDRLRMRAVAHAAMKRESDRVVQELEKLTSARDHVQRSRRIEAAVAESDPNEIGALEVDLQVTDADNQDLTAPQRQIRPVRTRKMGENRLGNASSNVAATPGVAGPNSARTRTDFAANTDALIPDARPAQTQRPRHMMFRDVDMYIRYNDEEINKLRQQQQQLSSVIAAVKAEPSAERRGAQAAAINQNENFANANRVFKLQFDARRIICCSQNPVIVIWDFANGDGVLEEASRFFRGVE